MKNNIAVPLPKVEDKVEAGKRRESYASTRDLQALEFNEAIARRIAAESKNITKCDKCGKEFTATGFSAGSVTCPECK